MAIASVTVANKNEQDSITQYFSRQNRFVQLTCPSAGLFFPHHLVIARSTSALAGPLRTRERAKDRIIVIWLNYLFGMLNFLVFLLERDAGDV